MEKLLINSQSFNLVPNGIAQSDKNRVFTILSTLSPNEIEISFSNVDRIEYLSESDEILATYLDGISVKAITHDLENDTYIIEVSTDAIERQIKELQAQIDALRAGA